jgi:Tfp pilus assembly protein PilP
VVDRITKNLQFFKETEYKIAINTINPKEVIHKYDGKLQKINDELNKLDKIIKNGCGNIVEKPATSRIKSEICVVEHKEISQI